MSPTVTLLSVADTITRAYLANSDAFQKQVVFAWFTGEAWGYLGSRRFANDING